MSFIKNKIKNIFSLNWFKQSVNFVSKKYREGLTEVRSKDFSKIDIKTFKKMSKIVGAFLLLIALCCFFEVYIPLNPTSHETITYTVQKGWGNYDISKELENLGMIRSGYFFRLYAIASFNHAELKAGTYSISPNMSIYQIVKKMANGDTIRDRFVIYEGWSVSDIGGYLETRNFCTKKEFMTLAGEEYSAEFKFLEEKPKTISLEGYLFPDSYEFSDGESCRDIIKTMLANFEKKLTPELQEKINSQNKTVFDVITMASLLEKEVKTLEDKKIVAGILWKRLSVGMPLQLDSTVNYITGNDHPSVTIKDTKINSPYNTYKYKGLPKGPISNPGMDSIIAALEPTKTAYWFYLSDGKTYFSKTLEEHNAAKARYLK
jgi:UPF0755 protein